MLMAQVVHDAHGGCLAMKGTGSAGSVKVLTAIRVDAKDIERLGLAKGGALAGLALALDGQQVVVPAVVRLPDGK